MAHQRSNLSPQYGKWLCRKIKARWQRKRYIRLPIEDSSGNHFQVLSTSILLGPKSRETNPQHHLHSNEVWKGVVSVLDRQIKGRRLNLN